MFREMIGMVYGSLVWNLLRLRLRIHDRKVVVILTGENKKLDYYAMVYLKEFMDRKYADEAVILLADLNAYKMIKAVQIPAFTKVYRYPLDKIERLYKYYSFYKFSDRVVFTYTDKHKDNQLGRALRETEIDEKDAACLGLYHLRTVPEKRDKA